MIGRLTGRLAAKHPPQVLVDVAGVAYEVDVPMSTLYALPGVGEPVTLFTHLVVREDAHNLYGFFTVDERAAFRQLIRISGIGARTALAVLSGMSVSDLAQSVALQDAARLTSIPGIGKKTAERLLLELKGKLAEAGASRSPGRAPTSCMRWSPSATARKRPRRPPRTCRPTCRWPRRFGRPSRRWCGGRAYQL